MQTREREVKEETDGTKWMTCFGWIRTEQRNNDKMVFSIDKAEKSDGLQAMASDTCRGREDIVQ